MGKCSYTWKEWNEENELVKRQCPEGTCSDSDRYCIFHYPSEKKDTDLFERKLQQKCRKKDYNFRGYYFPKDIEFDGFEDDVYFNDAVFSRKVSFNGSNFQKETYFNGATFQREVSFNGATFEEKVDFHRVSFQTAYFRAKFQNVSFHGAKFGRTYFSGAEFYEVSFTEAIFQDEASFDEAIFQDEASFDEATFLKNAYFGEVEFLEQVSFNGATFEEKVDFHRVSFQKAYFRAKFQDVSFHGAKFKETCFDKCKFQEASFVEAIFQENASFNKTTFQKEVSFDEALFRKQARFYRMNSQETYFKDTVFREKAYFNRATFKQKAYFNGATLGNAFFNRTTFQGNIFFNRTTFQNAWFEETTFQDVCFYRAVIERNLELKAKKNKRLDIRQSRFFKGQIAANVDQIRVYGADLENISFVKCNWSKLLYEERHRELIEKSLKKDEDSLKELQKIYRDLKWNMQRHGDYSQAGEFFFREMEIKRKHSRLFGLEWWKQNLLLISCGYGERPLRIIEMSVLIVILGATIFFFCGVARVSVDLSPEENPYEINYSLDSLALTKTAVVDFFYCMYCSVVTFTTLGYGDIQPLGYSHVFASLESFIGAFFIALFVLVFGKKMMR